MSQIIHGPPKIWGPGQLPDLPPLKPALLIRRIHYTYYLLPIVTHIGIVFDNNLYFQRQVSHIMQIVNYHLHSIQPKLHYNYYI